MVDSEQLLFKLIKLAAEDAKGKKFDPRYSV
jgi:hypothetical protein